MLLFNQLLKGEIMTIEKSEDTKICVFCLFGYIFASIAVISLLMFIFINKPDLVKNLIFFPTSTLIGPSIQPWAGLLPSAILIGCICGAVIGHLIGKKFGKHDLWVLVSSAFWGVLLPISFVLSSLALLPEF
jgi:hypothetical protein